MTHSQQATHDPSSEPEQKRDQSKVASVMDARPSTVSADQQDQPSDVAGRAAQSPRSIPRPGWSYVAISLLVAACGFGLIAVSNRSYAPEMYGSGYMSTVADALSRGENHAVFDLNINIRELKNELLKRQTEKPHLVILGASQWQEASGELQSSRGFFNAHVHRDYYEDMLGMVDMLVRHNKMPSHLVMTIRDKLFTPLSARTDHLWLPIIPYYMSMAKRLALDVHSSWKLSPLKRPRELISLPMLFDNMTRWHKAPERPHATSAVSHGTLDLLRPDGSIRWSDEHQSLFTPARARKLALEHAAASIKSPPIIDPAGVAAIDRLLTYLTQRGVRVHLAHPPFNPIFWEAVQGTGYIEGLHQVEAITAELAARHDLPIVGGFDPASLGCTADMFIDAEHSQAPCLSKLLADITNSMDLPKTTPDPGLGREMTSREIRSRRVAMADGWSVAESLRIEPARSIPMPVASSSESSGAATNRSGVAAVPMASAFTVVQPPADTPSKPAGTTPMPALLEIGRALETLSAIRPHFAGAETTTPSVALSVVPKPTRQRAETTRKPSVEVSSTRGQKAQSARRRGSGRTTAKTQLIWPGDRPTRAR